MPFLGVTSSHLWLRSNKSSDRPTSNIRSAAFRDAGVCESAWNALGGSRSRSSSRKEHTHNNTFCRSLTFHLSANASRSIRRHYLASRDAPACADGWLDCSPAKPLGLLSIHETTFSSPLCLSHGCLSLHPGYHMELSLFRIAQIKKLDPLKESSLILR